MKLFNAMFRPAKPQQMPPQGFGTFPLEEILTPSGLIDTSEETAAIATAFDLSDDLTLDFGLDSDFAAAEDSDSWQSPEDFGTLWTESGIDIPDEDFEDVDFFIPVPEDVLASIQFEFESGYFTVQDSGLVTVDYLFDGGGYQGELAIFSLDGMEEFELGSEAFVYEAARRALSGTEEGHIVISDRLEGARFDGQMLGEGGNWNSGDYLGAKTFQMRPGDEFGFMLVPSGRVETVFENPGIGGSETPLFSMSTANPDDMFAMGQLVDVFGDGNAFAFEDLRIDGGSDQDYNDIVFQVRGATGTTIYTGDLTSSNLGWLETDLGEAIKTYAQAYVDWAYDGFDANVSAPPEAQPLIGIIDTGFSANNPDIDYSRITLGSDWIDGDANPLLSSGEGNEHGTHILGLIGASRDNDTGIDGINDQAPLWLGRAVGSGQWANSLTEFVNAAIESGQPNAVVNLSLDLTQVDADGNVFTRYELTPQERAAIEYARQHNVLIVAAAGNDGGVMSALGQASQEFGNILTVGAAEHLMDNTAPYLNSDRTSYSSYGYGLDLLAFGGIPENPNLSLTGDGLGMMAGTSVATAKVTGAVSHLWAANPDLSYRQVIQILKDTATDLQNPNWDVETGSGLVNILAAVQLARATTPEISYAPPSMIPNSWSGEGVFVPSERPVQSPIVAEGFSGSPTPDIGTAYRYTPNHDDRVPGTTSQYLAEPFGETVQFDAWTYGERVSDYVLGTPKDLWYRVAGTDYWMPAAYIAGSPASQPSVLRPALPPINLPQPRPGYYPDLAELTDEQWNEYTQDNIRFDFGWPDFENKIHLTPQSIQNIYTDLSIATFGDRRPMTAGYLLDPGYRKGIGIWHSGVDLSAIQGTSVQVPVGGTILRGIQEINGNYFIGVQGDDGKLWIYGHLGTVAVPGGRIEAGQTIGTIGNKNHLHLELQAGPTYRSSQSANLGVVAAATLNPIKSFWELKNQGQVPLSDIPITMPGSFQGRIIATIGANVRSGPGRNFLIVGNRGFGTVVTFDEVRTGEFVAYPELGTATDQWYKIAGTNQWVSAAVVSGDPQNSVVDVPAIPGQQQMHIVRPGDTLWDIARGYLNDGRRWIELTNEDGRKFTAEEALRLLPGTAVYIPVVYQSGPTTPPPIQKPVPTPRPATRFEIARQAAIQRFGPANVGVSLGEPWRVTVGNATGWVQEFLLDGRYPRILMLEDGQDTAYWVHGDNLKEYQRLGGLTLENPLGFPRNDETPFVSSSTGATGVWQAFSGYEGNARIHNSWSGGKYNESVATWGDIGRYYESLGASNSWLGVPTQSEWHSSDGRTIWSRFEKGWITHNKETSVTESFAFDSRPSWIEESYKQEFFKYLQFESILWNKGLLAFQVQADTTWNMSLDEMLAKYHKLIMLASWYYGVSGQAIAGAIQWEYDKNSPSRERDLSVFTKVQLTGSWTIFNGTGWGKMHYKTAQRLGEEPQGLVVLDNSTDPKNVARYLANAFSSIDLIAQELRKASLAYSNFGFEIHNNPGILVTLYRSGEEEQSYEEKAQRAREENRQPQIEDGVTNVAYPGVEMFLPNMVTVMGRWVYDQVQQRSLSAYQSFEGEMEPYEYFRSVTA